MPVVFTVEDGSNVADANSYGAVVDADQYHLNRGNATWAALSETVKQQSLIKATDYLDQRFGDRFIGERTNETQVLEWPREYAGDFDDDVIPTKLQYACFEYALRASTVVLAPDPVVSDSGVTMVTTKQKAGPVEQSFYAVGGGTVQLLRAYPTADMYLRELVETNNRVIR